MLSTQNQTKSNWLYDIFSLIALISVFYAIWIGSHALFTPDEGRYSEVAREMVASSDYITPRLNGVAFLDKPVLYYWLQASAIKLFGVKEWALRFWPAFLGVLGCLMAYIGGRGLFNRRTGWLSAIILATSPLYYGGSHYANLDLEVASLVSDSLICFIVAMQGASGRLRNILLTAAYVFAGLAALTKGLIGIAFPAMIIGAWILILNRWKTLLQMRLITGMIIFFAITLPWYFLVQKANPEFLHFFFVTQQVARFLTMQDFNSKAPMWFYVPVVLGGLFPWSIFLFQALAQKIKQVWQNRQTHASELFLLLWFFIVFIFFSIPRSKTVGYILPVLPVGALLVGSYLNSIWQDRKRVLTATNVFIIVSCLVGVGLYFAPRFAEVATNFIPYLHKMAIIAVISGVGACLLVGRKTLTPLFGCALVMIIALLLTFISSASYINDKSVKPVALELKTIIKPEDEVVTFYKYYHDLPIYLERRITVVTDWHAADIPQRDNWVREMWYGMVFQDTKDWLIEDKEFWARWNSGKRLYVLTDKDNYRKLGKKATVYKLEELNDIVLLSNQASALTENPNFANGKSQQGQNG